MNSGETQSPEKNSDTSPTARLQTDHWFVFRDQRHFGPFTTNSVLIFLRRGFISKKHYVWKAGQTAWQPIGTLEVFNIPIAEEALAITDAEFVQLSGIEREDLVGYFQSHQSLSSSQSQKSKLSGVTELYETLKQKLNFRIKENISENND